MKIKGKKTGYLLHKISDNKYALCKILGEYDSEDNAQKDLIKLLVGNTTERKLLKKDRKRQ